MAFNFNAILKFSSSQAEAALTRTKSKFENLQSSVSKANKALSGIAKAGQSIGLVSAPMTLGLAFATKTAADFEQQMSNVKAVLLANDDEMAQITEVTKRLGATTVFTAKQAGEGAELLAQAGFTAEQIVAALPGVLDAAASSSVSMAEAADIVAGQLGAFGRPASDATKVADTLALTTAVTNTNFLELGEAMKFVAPIAKNAGLSLEETASAVGVLANAGVKGSLAGTALKNAILQLAKPSKEALTLFGGKDGLERATIRTVNGVKQLLPLEVIMANASKAIQGAKDPLEATAQAAEIFGIRGATAFGAFQSKLLETTTISKANFDAIKRGAEITGDNVTVEIGKTLPTLVAMRLQIAGAAGTAKEMARIRLDNFKGDVEQLSGAIDSLTIEMGSQFTKELRQPIRAAGDLFSVFALGFQQAASGKQITGQALDDLKNNQFAGLLQASTEFAQGFIQGLQELKVTARETFTTIQNFLRPILGETGMTAQEFGKLAAKILVVGAVVGPVIGAISVGFLVIAPIISGVASLFSLVSASVSILGSTAGFAFSALRLLSMGGLFTVTKMLSLLSTIAGPAMSIIRVGVLALMGPVGLVALKIAAIGAAIGAVVFGIDFLLRKVGLLKGPSLFERTVGMFGGLKDKFFGKAKEAESAGDESGAKLQNVFSAGFETPQSTPTQLVPEFLQTGIENQKLQSESIKQKAISAPPSEEIIQALKSSRQAPAQSGGSQPVVLNGKLETKISGKDLNIILTRAMIDNSEANGRAIDPLVKRRSIQNGLSFGVR
jgi:TP901 family phage tail tape measure protein